MPRILPEEDPISQSSQDTHSGVEAYICGPPSPRATVDGPFPKPLGEPMGAAAPDGAFRARGRWRGVENRVGTACLVSRFQGPSLAANKRGCGDWSPFSLAPTYRFTKPNFFLRQTGIAVAHRASMKMAQSQGVEQV